MYCIFTTIFSHFPAIQNPQLKLTFQTLSRLPPSPITRLICFCRVLNQFFQRPIQLPNSSSASVPTILDRLRLEIEAENKYSHPNQPNNKIILPPRQSWFDEERHEELTNSTSLSNTSVQQQIDRQYWEENKQLNDLIGLQHKNLHKTSYTRFQRIDEPLEIQPTGSNYHLNALESKPRIVSFTSNLFLLILMHISLFFD